MTRVLWDQVGEKVYETGVDRGVLYIPDNTGDYVNGYAWNGLTAVTESPSGAESNKQYADNTVYLNLKSAEEFGATLEAFTYPDEFGQCDGTAAPTAGVRIGQQVRKTFGLSYRSLLGNDLEGTEYGYKIHLIYGADAAPSERAYGTVNDSPEAITFSWELMTTPVPVGTINSVEYKPTSYIEIDSTVVDAAALASLEDLLYGTGGTDPSLPTPAEVVALFAGAVTEVLLTGSNAPTFVSGTGVITLPAVTGVTWKINGVVKTAGAQPAISAATTATVTSHLGAGYVYAAGSDNDWSFTRP